MSWDIFIQDLPNEVSSTDEIPEDFDPAPLGDRAKIVAHVVAAFPGLRLDEEGFGCFENEHGSVEVSVGSDQQIASVMISVRGEEGLLPYVIEAVKRLGGKALDSGSDSGIWDAAAATASYEKWRKFRDRVVRS